MGFWGRISLAVHLECVAVCPYLQPNSERVKLRYSYSFLKWLPLLPVWFIARAVKCHPCFLKIVSLVNQCAWAVLLVNWTLKWLSCIELLVATAELAIITFIPQSQFGTVQTSVTTVTALQASTWQELCREMGWGGNRPAELFPDSSRPDSCQDWCWSASHAALAFAVHNTMLHLWSVKRGLYR